MPSHNAPNTYIAGLLCLLGFSLHIILSDPLLTLIGVHYSSEDGFFYEKIHPGTVLIFISFFVLLWQRGRPIVELLHIYNEHRIFLLAFALYLFTFFYMWLISGIFTLGFILDTHISAILCAIVISYAPKSLCKKALWFFIIAAALNAIIGIAESAGKFRIFTFDSNWVVLNEEYFRASAFLGHPLNNACFTAIALFIALALPLSKILKFLLVTIFMLALVAFGGRAALVFSFVGLIMFAINALQSALTKRQFTLQQLFLATASVIAVPVFLISILYFSIHSPLGERIAESIQWEDSADSRIQALKIFHYMSDEEIIFGMSGARIMDIDARLSSAANLYDIENPWLLMFMHMGIILFPLWVLAILCFFARLIKDNPLALQLAVLAYFVIASTSNSFGRKDSNFAIMVTVVICASKLIFRKDAFHAT